MTKGKIIPVAAGTPPRWKEYLKYLNDKKLKAAEGLKMQQQQDIKEFNKLPWYRRAFKENPADTDWRYVDWTDYSPSIIGYYNWDVRTSQEIVEN